MDVNLIDILTQLGNLGAPLSVSLMLYALMRLQMKAVNASIDRMLTLIERLALECRELTPPTIKTVASPAESVSPDSADVDGMSPLNMALSALESRVGGGTLAPAI